MDFVVGDVVRQGFGFANPNHAAAAICAAFPFCWGWRGVWRWAGRLVGVALCVMLAMTYSRTGALVLVCEIVALLLGRKTLSAGMIGRVETCRTSARSTRSTRLNIMQGRGGLATAVVVVAIAAWWMWPRLALDGAILNRPKIWLAGLQLFAANPMGVGFGNSGAIASAFMLPDGITVRTLVNSHLTLLAGMGALVGGVMACVHRAGAWCRADNAAYVGGVRGACGFGVFSVGEDEGSVGEPPMRYDIDTLTDNRVYCPRYFRVGVFHTRVVYTVPARKATLNRIFQVMNGMLVKREGYCGLSRSDHARKTLCGVCCSRFHELDCAGRCDNARKAVRTQG